MDAIQKTLLEQVAGLHEVPTGAYSIRVNGQLYGKNDSENISIVKKRTSPALTFTSRRARKTRACTSPSFCPKAD